MTKRERTFVDTVWRFYREHGRHMLPWRTIPQSLPVSTRAYRILVSEVMLQQTQVDRVIPKYRAFIRRFPNARALAHAPLGDVLTCWQGLGYNRRAKMLHACAKEIIDTHKGRFPRTFDALTTLPGIGPYTAGAVCAFAFNTPVVLIETNLRTVYLHHFFRNKTNVTDTAIHEVIERTLDRENPRAWYAALMDYGAYLKRAVGNPNTQSKHYTKQSKFAGSDRQIRGAILRAATAGPLTLSALPDELRNFSRERLTRQMDALVAEGMLEAAERTYRLP